MHHQCIHQCTINAFINASSMHRASCNASSETQGQIVGARESLNGQENMARRKVKNGEKSPCDIVPRGSTRRSLLLFFVPYFSARLDFPSPPLSAPGSPRMFAMHIINAFIIAFLNASSMHYQYIINAFITSNVSISFIQFFLSSSVHRQCIYQCITNVFINVFINASSMQSINASPMYLQCFKTHHQCFINALSMHSSTNHQSIVSAFVNASSMHLSIYHQCIYLYNINASLLHQMHEFRSFNSFFHLSNSSCLVHLHCCSAIRSFVAVTPSAFLLSFLNSLYPFNSFFRPSLRSFAVRSCIQSSTIISVPR